MVIIHEQETAENSATSWTCKHLRNKCRKKKGSAGKSADCRLYQKRCGSSSFDEVMRSLLAAGQDGGYLF
jgi:hypothetical protein